MRSRRTRWPFEDEFFYASTSHSVSVVGYWPSPNGHLPRGRRPFACTHGSRRVRGQQFLRSLARCGGSGFRLANPPRRLGRGLRWPWRGSRLLHHRDNVLPAGCAGTRRNGGHGRSARSCETTTSEGKPEHRNEVKDALSEPRVGRPPGSGPSNTQHSCPLFWHLDRSDQRPPHCTTERIRQATPFQQHCSGHKGRKEQPPTNSGVAAGHRHGRDGVVGRFFCCASRRVM